MTTSDYTKFKASIERNLAGLSFLSTGACKCCAECGLGESPSDHAIELADEPSFSWHACDACGSTLGGDRHPAHGRTDGGKLLHLSVCSDCLYFLNYGKLDDKTMMEMETA